VEFDVVDDELRIRKAGKHRSRGGKIVQHLAGQGSVKMSTDEIMQLTRHE